MAPVKLVLRTTVLAAALLVVTAAPAAAEGPGTRHWFFNAAPLFLLAGIGLIIALGVGYYVRVLRPKFRGR